MSLNLFTHNGTRHYCQALSDLTEFLREPG